MKIPRIELFEWLRNNHERADYVLAYSKMKGVSKREYDELVDYDPGPELDLGRGDPHGANEFIGRHGAGLVLGLEPQNTTVEVNGKNVNEMNLDEWTESNKNPDGSKNKFPRAIKDFARKGYIGLQDHGGLTQFRNIKIKEL